MTVEASATAVDVPVEPATTDTAPPATDLEADDFSEYLKRETRAERNEEAEESDFQRYLKREGTKGEHASESKDPDTDEQASLKPKEQERKIYKLKVNDKEIEFDATSEENVKRAIQKGLAADERFQQASLLQKQAENFIRALKQDPVAILSHPQLGINFREIAETYLYNQIQQDQLTPEERARLQEKEELERYRRQEEEARQREEVERNEQLKEKYRQDWSKKFTEALESNGLPKTDWTISRMAQYMRQAIQKGYKHIQPADVVDYVKQDWINAQRQLFQHLDGEKLIEMLGEDTVEKIRKQNVARYKQEQGATGREPKKVKVDKRSGGKRRYSSIYDMIDDLG